MKYRVRNKDGELEFPTFGYVEHFWLMGFIEPDDEILEEGKTVWRKASSYPVLVNAVRSGEKVWAGTWFLWTVAGVILGCIAVGLLVDKNYVWGMVVGLIDAVIILNVNIRAYQRRKPHHKLR